ncbi:MAG: carbon monoxide dehydrogenase [Candidatus Bathyarchaeota archaeon B26-2]|nr:MAG: carbon monoxide dehydrogenase [Candidatus Bathyarchaeota archaeon B26-2]
MKIAVAGKGGVGKTLIAGTLSRLLARDGFRVLAVDADPAMNLAYAIGIPPRIASKIVPIAENRKLIEERTGAKPGSAFGVFIRLTPTVRDIAERFGVLGPDDVRLLVVGTIRYGGSGCACPANTLIRSLLRHITMARKDVVVMDMEAGLEHLGRATVKGFDVLLCIVEPGAQSIETAGRINRLAKDINVKEVLAVGNKVTSSLDEEFIKESAAEVGLDVIGIVPFDPEVLRADRMRVAPIDFAPSSPAISAIKDLKDAIRVRTGYAKG